jgi:5-methylcytosine-specific restriction endonuclease McrA
VCIFERDGWRCVYCGTVLVQARKGCQLVWKYRSYLFYDDGSGRLRCRQQATRDHVRERGQGGVKGSQNIVACCGICNRTKSARDDVSVRRFERRTGMTTSEARSLAKDYLDTIYRG